MEVYEKSIMFNIHCINGVTNSILWYIKNEYGSFTNFFELNPKAMYNSKIPNEIVDKIVDIRKNGSIESNFNKLYEQDIKVTYYDDLDYPILLKNIHKIPLLLYYKGDLNILNKFTIGIVGSRTASAYGRKVARDFAKDLSNLDITIISGMARGIDTEAHWGSLEANGYTTAVLGSGIDVIYPKENKKLYEEISNNGVIITEFAPKTNPLSINFPQRNRIISALSRGLLVVEAKEKSGALITVDFALEQGKDVFAVPGPITSQNSAGTNQLIKDGAKLVTKIEDILDEYMEFNNTNTKKQYTQNELLLLDKEENLVLQCIGYDLINLNELFNTIDLEIGKISTILLKLELEGIIKALPGNNYVRV